MANKGRDRGEESEESGLWSSSVRCATMTGEFLDQQLHLAGTVQRRIEIKGGERERVNGTSVSLCAVNLG